MKRPNEIAVEEAAMTTLVELTSAFEGLASMRISKTKSRVEQSTKFFSQLWQIYTQLRVDPKFNYGRTSSKDIIDKELFIIITSEGGLSGEIDFQLIDEMLKSYDKDKNDIIVVGRHGAMRLAQNGVSYQKYFKLPEHDDRINTAPIANIISQYRSTRVFYQQYISLMHQEVKQLELSNAIKVRGDASDKPGEIISDDTYIFEPSSYAVAAHLENSMTQIAISQLILDSKLAQYASRFRAMSASHELSEDNRQELHTQFNRARRAIKDERLKEIVNGLKKARAMA